MFVKKGVMSRWVGIGGVKKEAADTSVEILGTGVTQHRTRGNPNVNFSKKVKRLAISCAALSIVCLFTNVSVAEDVGYKGAGHNGVFLRATKTPASGAGIIVTLELECRKNWGGISAGAAFVQVVGVEAGEYKELDMKCKATGGGDGATKNAKTTKGLFLKDSQTAVIVGTIAHQSKSNWEVWQRDIENTVKSTIDQVVKSATDPKAIISAASGAGLIGTIL